MVHLKLQIAVRNGLMSLEQAVKLLSEKPDDYKLNLSHCSFSTWPKKLWQVCFNVYREFSCPLDNMHDMMCDYDNIKRVLGEYHEPAKPVEFYWYFDPGYRFTVFNIRESYGEEFGIHFKQTDAGNFAVRYLLPVSKGGDDATDNAGE